MEELNLSLFIPALVLLSVYSCHADGDLLNWDSFISERFGDGNIPAHWNWRPTYGANRGGNQLVQTLLLQPANGRVNPAPPVVQIKSVYGINNKQKANHNSQSVIVANPVQTYPKPTYINADVSKDTINTKSALPSKPQAKSHVLTTKAKTAQQQTSQIPTTDGQTMHGPSTQIQTTPQPQLYIDFSNSIARQPEGITPPPSIEPTTIRHPRILTHRHLSRLPQTSNLIISKAAKKVTLSSKPHNQVPGTISILAKRNPSLTFDVKVGDVPTVQLPGSSVIIAKPSTETTTIRYPKIPTNRHLSISPQNSNLIISKAAKIVTLDNKPYNQVSGTSSVVHVANRNPYLTVDVEVGDVPTIQLPGSSVIIAKPSDEDNDSSEQTVPAPVPIRPASGTTPTPVRPAFRTTPTPFIVRPTTTSPTTVIPPVVDDNNECSKCNFKHGVGFLPHKTDCTKFLKCEKLRYGGYRASDFQCPFGLYWNNKIFSCDYPRNTKCTNHPCLSATTPYIGMSGRCAGYWKCDWAAPVGYCCPNGYSFNTDTQDCQIDAACNDTCSGPEQPDKVVCDKREVSGSKGAFEQKVPVNRWVKQYCPASTGFNQTTCQCSDWLPVPQPQLNTVSVCSPDLHVSFTGGVKDDSRNKYYIENRGVTTHSGNGVFDGNSKLIVYRYANAPFGKDLTIEMVYRTADMKNEQVLISNGDCGEVPSLYIIAGSAEVTFSIKTDLNSNPYVVKVPITSRIQLNHVKLALYNNKLTGEVNGVSKSTFVEGSIEVRKNSLVIGSGGKITKFSGIIDDIKLYFCQTDGK